MKTQGQTLAATLTLALAVGLVTTSAHAERLWTERTTSRATVQLPSLAPLVKESEPAVLTISVESRVKQGLDPRDPRIEMFRRFGMQLDAPEQKQLGQGTGFIIHPDGYALTNHHVIEGATKITVRVGSGGEEYTAKVIGDDERTDVALIKLDGNRHDWPCIPLGDSEALQVGDLSQTSGGQETYLKTTIKLSTQEIRAQSIGDTRFKWTVGGLYWYEQLEQFERNLRCAGPTGGCGTIFASINDSVFFNPNTVIKRNTRHLSAFGSASYEVFTNLTLEAEVRYTSEKERTSGFPAFAGTLGCPAVTTAGRTQLSNGTVVCVTPGALVGAAALVNNNAQYNYVIVPSKYWAPRFTVDYKFNPEALVYASAALGKKPGGNSSLSGVIAAPNAAGQRFTLDAPASGPAGTIVNANRYDPESMWVYEVGAKTSWLNNRLQVNGAIYYQDYSAKQVSLTVVDPLTQQLTLKTVNAAKASVKGLELDINAALTDNVSFNVGYTYNDGKYDQFIDLQSGVSAISRAAINNPNSCTVVAVGTPAQNRCQISYKGNQLEGSPKHSLQLGGEVRGDITDNLGWFVDTDVRYTSKRFTSFENYLYMEPYWIVDMRAGFKTGKFTITAYVNNLFDDDTMKASAVSVQNWSLAYLTNSGRTPLATQAPSSALALLPDKRQFGIRGSYNF